MTPTLNLIPRGPLARLATRLFNRPLPIPPPEQKRLGGAPLMAFNNLGQPIWAPRDYAAFAREGFMQNAVVYRCVRMIAENAAAIPLLLYSGDTEIEHHPLIDLIRRPNPNATTADLLETLFGFLLVSGNAYIEAVAVGGKIRELHVLRPDRIKVIPGPDGWPEAHEYTVDGKSIRIEGDAVPGVPRILHLKLFHPTNDHYGLSPIEAAASSIDLHNTAARWNKALLDNSARPSGALVYTSRDGNLTPDQFERLKAELESGFQGAGNAGRPLLLEGGLDWKAMSMSPKDLDFVEAKNSAAREIALALGVPPMLLGIPGDNTYSNYKEANASLWRQSIIPLINRAAAALTEWLSPAFPLSPSLRGEGWGEGRQQNEREGRQQTKTSLALIPDLDQIEALSIERDSLWTRLESATFLTTEEKRAAAGYGPMPPATKSRKPLTKEFDPDQARDEFGRWTNGDGALQMTVEDVFDVGTNDEEDLGQDLIRIQSAGDDPPLKRMHPDKTYESDRLAKSSLEFWRKQPTDVIVESLRPDARLPLTTYPDGTVADGNTRVKALEERGYDTSKLPRTLRDRTGAPFTNPNLRPNGGPLGKKPQRS